MPICRLLRGQYRPFGNPSVTGFSFAGTETLDGSYAQNVHASHTPAHTREDRMRRLNFLDDEPWDEVDEQQRRRWFGHPLGTDMLGASLTELSPGSPGGHMHMHYGLEEMFFVLRGTPTVRTPEGEEQ